MDPITTLQTAQQNLITALANDALNPLQAYSLDGQAVDRAAWRDSLMKEIAWINQAIQELQPFELQQAAISW